MSDGKELEDAKKAHPQRPQPPIPVPSPSDEEEAPQYFYRYVSSEKEMEMIGPPGALGVLREGRAGQTFFTTGLHTSATEAKAKLALPLPPLYRVAFKIVTSGPIIGPSQVAPKFGENGGGIEYYSVSPPPVVVGVLDVAKLD